MLSGLSDDRDTGPAQIDEPPRASRSSTASGSRVTKPSPYSTPMRWPLAAAGQLHRLAEAVEGQRHRLARRGVNWLAKAAIAASFWSQTAVMSTTNVGVDLAASVVVRA